MTKHLFLTELGVILV